MGWAARAAFRATVHSAALDEKGTTSDCIQMEFENIKVYRWNLKNKPPTVRSAFWLCLAMASWPTRTGDIIPDFPRLSLIRYTYHAECSFKEKLTTLSVPKSFRGNHSSKGCTPYPM